VQQCKDIDKKFKQRYSQDFNEPPRVYIWFHLVVLDAEARSLVREQGGIDFTRVKRSKGTGEWLSHRYEDLDFRPCVLQ